MPTYAYRCATCSHQFEVVQRFSDDPLTECPECGGPVRKVFHPVGIVFKGSGWYINDSRKTESTPTQKASTDSDGGSPAKETTTKDKKSEPASIDKTPAKAAAD